MLVYRFRASSSSNLLEGEVLALSPAKALERIRRVDPQLEFETVKLDMRATVSNWVERWFPIPGLELSQFFRQLYLLFTAGIELSKAVRVLAESCPYPRLRNALFEIDRGIHEGNMFSDMLKRYPRLFPPFVAGMLAVGEQTGTFQETVDRAATLLEKDYDRFRRVQSALVYPAFLLIASLGLFGAMILIFLPKMAEVLNSMGSDMPLGVQLLLGAGRALSDGTLVGVMLMGLAAAVAILLLWLQTPAGRYQRDAALLRIPVLNRVFRSLALSRFSYSMCLVVRSGMPMSMAMRLLSDAVGNQVIARSIEAARERLEDGDSLSESLEWEEFFAGLFRHMVEVGEESSRLDAMLDYIQRIYTEELDLTLDTATQLIEPIILTVMGVLVGGLVIAFMLPLSHMVSRL